MKGVNYKNMRKAEKLIQNTINAYKKSEVLKAY